MRTEKRVFPDSSCRVVHQTGQALTNDTKGVEIHLHWRDGEPLPCSAEVISGPNDEHYADVGLEWTGRLLTGYDGVFEIPSEILTMLKDLGFAVDPSLSA